MKKKVFSKKELLQLPFNYQYIMMKEEVADIDIDSNSYSPHRKISINTLHTTQHLVTHPTKVISKIIQPPSNVPTK